MNSHHPMVDMLARVLLAMVFFSAAMGKLAHVASTQQYMATYGLSPHLVWPVIALELVGSIALVIGWQTRQISALLAAFCVVTALVFHRDFQDPMQEMAFMKNLAMAGGFLLLMKHGPGRWSMNQG